MVSRKKSGPKRTKKGSPKKRTKAQKLKNITIQDKLALYLNDALSIENTTIERLQSRISQTRLQDSKLSTATSSGGNKRTTK